MSCFVSNSCFYNHDEGGIPEEIILTFTNGEKVYYKRNQEESLSSRNKLACFSQPKYDLSEEKIDEQTFDALSKKFALQLRSVDQQYQLSASEAEVIYVSEKTKIAEYAEQKGQENDQLYTSLSKEMLENYRSLKKEIHNKAAELETPRERLKIMINWLVNTKDNKLLEAAQMLEFESEYILGKLNSPGSKWDCFLSHVQKNSADVCRNIADRLEKKGVSVWLDKDAGRLDKHGMVEGVIDSKLFVLILSKDYFTRPFCIFEWCIAAVAGKPVITVAESDPRYGGEPIESLNLYKLFSHILNHQVIDIHRSYWNAFTLKLYERIQSTIKSKAMKSVEAVKPLEEWTASIVTDMGGWNRKKSSSNLVVDSDKVTITSQTIFGQTGVGMKKFSKGRQRFAVEIVNISGPPYKTYVIVGVVTGKFQVSQSISRNSNAWAYSCLGKISCGDGYSNPENIKEYGKGDVIIIQLDFNEKTIEFFKNGTPLGVAFTNLISPVYPFVKLFGKNTSVRLLMFNKN